MGSCCATVKTNVVFPQHSLNSAGLKESGPRLEDLEVIPQTRHIIRGFSSQNAEKSGQEKTIFTSSPTVSDLFAALGLSYCCKKGLKSALKNQDDFSVVFEKNTLFISVFDGHGVNGCEISNYLHIELPNIILSHPKFPNDLDLIFTESFIKCNTLLHQYCESISLSSEFSGSTCTVIIIKDQKVHIANIGDSRAIYEDSLGNSVVLSTDHKLTIVSESERVQKCGGEVRLLRNESCPRIFAKDSNLPGISVSRAFGDNLAQSIGVSVDPDLLTKDIGELDKFLIVASDGVWEFISTQKAVDIIHEADLPARALVDSSWDQWIEKEGDAVDDITAIVVNLQVFNKYLKSLTGYPFSLFY